MNEAPPPTHVSDPVDAGSVRVSSDAVASHQERQAAVELPGECFEPMSAAERLIAEGALNSAELPVMQRTARRLEKLREQGSDVAVIDLTEIILDDALMTMRLLGDAADAGAATPKIESVTAALVMIGVDPFFARYTELPVAEPRLANNPAAQAEYQRLNRVSARAARLAGAFCGAANDPDVPIVYLAALLHASARLKLCLHAPAVGVSLRGRPCEFELSAAVMARHHLPTHLVSLVGGNAERLDPQMNRVRLAVLIAHALESGWSSPNLPDLLTALGRLLGLSPARSRQLVESVRV